jgi:dipeptidyl aminopeptidase/acylaminoacyl peptidase
MRYSGWILALLGAASACWAGSDGDGATGRDWTVKDSIGVRYFVVRNPKITAKYAPPGWIREVLGDDEPVSYSPDGKRFFYTSFHGDYAKDEIVYELSVFSVEAVKRALAEARNGDAVAPEPLHTVRLASGYSDDFDSAGIFNPVWADEHTIHFVGVNGRGPHRIFRLDAITGDLTPLTDDSHDVNVPSPFVAGQESILFVVREKEAWKPLETYPRTVIRGRELWQIMQPERRFWRIYASFKGGPAQRVTSRGVETSVFGPFLSPDEKWAVTILPPEDMSIPDEWLEYEVPSSKGYRFLLIDMEHGTTRQMIDAPAGTVTESGRGRAEPFVAFWSADSRHVILYNSALPLSENAEERTRTSYILDYSISSNESSILQPMREQDGRRVGKATWLKAGHELFVSYEDGDKRAPAGIRYRYVSGEWKRSSVERMPRFEVVSKQTPPKGLRIELRQSADMPPTIVASGSGHELPLSTPDPALEGVWRANSRAVEWPEPGNRKGRGLLFLPRAPAANSALPLVIELASYQPKQFRPDGGPSSAFATQALVARGFAVLQVDFFQPDFELTEREGPATVERIDAAVDLLASQGVADRNRVGLVGHSRTGYLTYYVVTHPGRTKVAGAVVFDSITASYGEYVSDSGFGFDSARIYEKQYGNKTFWQNKQGWLDAPAFNVDKVTAPVLFSAAGDTNAGNAIETVGAFRINERPFEYHFYSAASHNLQRPKEREAAMQATVDWLGFWILGQAPSSPSDDGDRPRRWERIKAAWVEKQRGDK